MSVALICGVGEGLGAALCRTFASRGLTTVGVSRSPGRIADEGVPMQPMACDITQPDQVEAMVTSVEREFGPISLLVHNAAAFSHGPFLDARLEAFERAWEVGPKSAFLLAQQVLPGMLKRNSGTIIFTGATASRRGSSKFAALASSKFGLRGLAQSLAREFGKDGIHVAHVIIDGVIWCDWTRERFGVERDACLLPDSIANRYAELYAQPRDAWSHEIDLRPAGERF